MYSSYILICAAIWYATSYWNNLVWPPLICFSLVQEEIDVLERRSVDFKTISVLFVRACSEGLCVAMLFICEVIKLPAIMMSLQTETTVGAFALYRPRVGFMHGMSAFDSRLILSYFLGYFAFHIIKGIRKSYPCIVEIRGMQDRAFVGEPALAYGS